MVGPCGLEPQTSTVSRWRSSQLSYGPTVAESISSTAWIVPYFPLGAQFGSHHDEYEPSRQRQVLAVAPRAECDHSVLPCALPCSQTTREYEPRSQSEFPPRAVS